MILGSLERFNEAASCSRASSGMSTLNGFGATRIPAGRVEKFGAIPLDVSCELDLRLDCVSIREMRS